MTVALIFGVTGAWAADGTAVVKMTYVDYDNPTTAIGEIAPGETAKAGYNKISGGSVGFGNTGWGENKITYIQVDASAIEGTITGATLTAEVTGIDGKRSGVYGVGYNASTWSADLTYETADKTITTVGNTYTTSTRSNTTFETATFDISNALVGDEDKVVTILMYDTNPGSGYIKNPSVTITYVSGSEAAAYTVKYVCDGKEVKETTTGIGTIGGTYTVTDEDRASCMFEGAKYIYVSDDAASQIIAEDGSTVITVTFREAATWNYTVNAVDGDGNLLKTLKTGTNFEAEVFDVAYAAYINVDGTVWKSGKISSDKKGYYFSMDLNQDNLTKDITFTASDITDVVYFSEAEDIEGLALTANNNTFIRSSNGASAYAADGDVVFTTLPNGKYKVATVICDATKNAGSVWNFKAGEQNIFEFTASNVNWAEGTSEEFELNAASTDIALAQGGGANQGVDLIYIIKTGDAELVEETMPVAENIAAAKEEGMRDKEIKLNVTGAKVTLYGGNNMMESFIEDETGALMVDFNISKLLGEDGVALTGYIIGKITKDQTKGGVFTFKGTDNTATSEITKEATEIVPAATTIADINAGQVCDVTSKFVRLENVSVKYEDTGWSADISLVDGDQELTVNDAMFVLPEDMSVVEKFNSICGVVMYGYYGMEFVPYGAFDAVEKQIEFTEVANIAALKDIANDTDIKLALNNTQIKVLEGGRWDKAIYIEDETAGIQILDEQGEIFTELGQTFNGYIYLKYKDEYGMRNLETAGYTYTHNSEYTVEVKDVVAKEVAWTDATNANYNMQLIKVNNVELAEKIITEGESSYSILYLKSGDKEMNMSDMFSKAYDENGGKIELGMYNVTGIIMEGPVYDENYEVAGYTDYFIPAGETAFETVVVEPVADLRKWDFRTWSEETVANMAADAASVVPTDNGDGTFTYPSVTPWRSYEKVGGPTEADPDREGNAYWYGTAIDGSEELTANGVVIAETKGLLFNKMAAGALAVGINYPSTSLGTYNGPSYLWIGGKNNSFTIPTVKSGSKVYIGIESHKNTDARGVKLTIDGVELGQAVPKTFEEFVFTVPGETTDETASDIVVTNTNGCHIYYIYVDATGEVDGINGVKADVNVVDNAVYTINGVKVRNAGESLEGLAKGMYIIGGKKVVVK